MTVSLLNLHLHLHLCLSPSFPARPRTRTIVPQKRFNFASTRQSPFSHSLVTLINSRRISNSIPKSASVNGFAGDDFRDEKNVGLLENLDRFVVFLRSVLPGGSWWKLPDHVQVVGNVKPVTLFSALGRMWGLVAEDRWVIFTAFAALILAALSEISIPHFLAASIFSAQSGEAVVFHRNAQLLILFCIASGICRSRSLVYEVAVLVSQI